MELHNPHCCDHNALLSAKGYLIWLSYLIYPSHAVITDASNIKYFNIITTSIFFFTFYSYVLCRGKDERLSLFVCWHIRTYGWFHCWHIRTYGWFHYFMIMSMIYGYYYSSTRSRVLQGECMSTVLSRLVGCCVRTGWMQNSHRVTNIAVFVKSGQALCIFTVEIACFQAGLNRINKMDAVMLFFY